MVLHRHILFCQEVPSMLLLKLKNYDFKHVIFPFLTKMIIELLFSALIAVFVSLLVY
jgi:hypothetical protein